MKQAQKSWENFQKKLKALPQWAYFTGVLLWLLPLGTVWTFLFLQLFFRKRGV